MSSPSPFPGMDPYLERHWRDVHSRLVAYASDALNEVLPGDLLSRVEERVVIEPEDELRRLVAPDVRVVEGRDTGVEPAPSTGAVVAEPVVLTAQVEPLTERYVRVVDANSERLVTVLKFVSPTNKRRGEGMREYVGKRRELLAAGVHVVEVDLVRAGDWLGLLMPFVPHAKYHTAYRVVEYRGDRPGEAKLYPISLGQRLPVVPVPLRAGDPRVTLDLQALVDQAYRNGRYGGTDYSGGCEPPLEGEDAAWAGELLAKAGKR